MGIDVHDNHAIYCRLLGHDVPFRYCRQLGQAGEGLPCRLVFDCWHETFDIRAFVRDHFSPEQIDRIQAPPPNKLAAIVEIAQRAAQV